MTDITGREPALPQEGEITGREPALGKDALRKHAQDMPFVSWDDPRVQWSGVRRIVLTLSMPEIHVREFRGMDHPLIMAVRGVTNQGVAQLALSSYRAFFMNILAIERISDALEIKESLLEVPFLRVGYEITLQGRIVEIDLMDLPEGVSFPTHQVFPERVRVGFRYLNPMPPSPYFSPLVD